MVQVFLSSLRIAAIFPIEFVLVVELVEVVTMRLGFSLETFTLSEELGVSLVTL